MRRPPRASPALYAGKDEARRPRPSVVIWPKLGQTDALRCARRNNNHPNNRNNDNGFRLAGRANQGQKNESASRGSLTMPVIHGCPDGKLTMMPICKGRIPVLEDGQALVVVIAPSIKVLEEEEELLGALPRR